MDSTYLKESILGAALKLSSERGLDEVSTAELCRAAGASNGSLFHFFPTKAALEGALYLRALDRYQASLAGALERSGTAEAGVRSLVRAHVQWVLTHRAEARLLHQSRRRPAGEAVEHEVADRNRAFFGRLAAWQQAHVRQRALRSLPAEVWLAAVLGPAHTLARLSSSADGSARLRAAAPLLADVAWAAVAPPSANGGARAARPRRRSGSRR